MSNDRVYVLGSFMTPFGRFPEATHKELTAQVVLGALEDARLASAERVDSVHFGSCAMHLFKQTNVCGQSALSPLHQHKTLPANVPIVNVEAACATGSAVFHGAYKEIASGAAQLALGVGVDKTFLPDRPALMLEMFNAALDQQNPELWKSAYAEAAEGCGVPFSPVPGRIMLLDVCAAQAAWHMKTHGTTARQIAAAAAKNHRHGALNPKAQYRKAMSVDEVLADKAIIGPLTRSMCAPISDGGAAVLLCSEKFLASQPAQVQERAVHVRGLAMAGGHYRKIHETPVTRVAAERAYQSAGLSPSDIHVAEVHDATSFAEVHLVEQLGFCDEGKGGALTESGTTELGGKLPVNLSGGLVSKGHPLAATGLAMVSEIHHQLLGEAGPRQANGARVGLVQNAGGLMGFDEALSSVIVLERR